MCFDLFSWTLAVISVFSFQVWFLECFDKGRSFSGVLISGTKNSEWRRMDIYLMHKGHSSRFIYFKNWICVMFMCNGGSAPTLHAHAHTYSYSHNLSHKKTDFQGFENGTSFLLNIQRPSQTVWALRKGWYAFFGFFVLYCTALYFCILSKRKVLLNVPQWCAWQSENKIKKSIGHRSIKLLHVL